MLLAAGRLVSSETGTWLAEHFTETLGDMKRLVDELFGFRHQPRLLSRHVLFAG